MFTCQVDTTGIRQLEVMVKERINDAMEQAVKAAGKYAVQRAKLGRFKDQTGQLRSTIYFDYHGWTRAGCEGDLVAPMQYASYVEKGTDPHEIWPKAGYNAPIGSLKSGQTRRARGPGPHEHIVGRGIALRWVDGSGEHFAPMVNHPGTSPLPFMQPAADVAADELVRQLRRFLSAITVS
jgi:hypothetical protein